MIYLTGENGVLDIRNNRIYSEVRCSERNSKYFIIL